MSNHAGTDRITIPHIKSMKAAGRRITALTAYDFPTAQILDESGLDIILVGDSLAMVVLGHPDTLSVTMDEMIHHTTAVCRGAKRSLVVADMPFLSYQVSSEEALRNAGRFLKEAGAQAVKLEGGGPNIVKTVSRLVDAGIPVMGHLGLTPQHVNTLGGYKQQGKEEAAAEQIASDALALEEAGTFAIVLELIPAPLASRITGELSIPTIGIGAGPTCDGQVLVTPDMLGTWDRFTPKFVKRYAEIGKLTREAVSHYVDEVRSGIFPTD